MPYYNGPSDTTMRKIHQLRNELRDLADCVRQLMSQVKQTSHNPQSSEARSAREQLRGAVAQFDNTRNKLVRILEDEIRKLGEAHRASLQDAKSKKGDEHQKAVKRTLEISGSLGALKNMRREIP